MSRPKHIIKNLNNTSVRLINENFRSALDELELANFKGGEINTGDVIINQTYVQTNNIITGKQEVVCEVGDDIQEKIDSIASTGGIVALRNGTYTLTDDINLPSGVYLHGETAYGVVLDFVDNTHGIKSIGTNVYTTGTISIAPGSSTVAGSGTSWLTNAAPGQYILLDQAWSLIVDVVSDTEITIELPYGWEPISGGDYIIASVISGVEFRNFIVTNASIGIDIQYADQFTMHGITTTLSGVGINVAHVSSCDIVNSYNLYNNYCLYITDAHLMKGDNFYSLGSQVGFGTKLTGVENSTIKNAVTAGNAINGMEFVSCQNLVVEGTFIQNMGNAVYIYGSSDIVLNNCATEYNGDCGVSIEGSSNITLSTVSSNYNTNDGFKITGCNDIGISTGHALSNGGYGIDIDITSSNNLVVAQGFSSNSSGDINDLGTGTIISGCLGVGNKNINYLLPDQTSNSGKVLKTDGTDVSWQDDTGFTGTMDDITDGTTYVKTHNDYTDADKTTVGNTSGTNTGDQDLSGLIAKTTNITSLNETGIADGELAVFNLTNKDIRTSNVTITTTIGADHTTVPTSQAVAEAIVAGGGYTDEMAQDAVGGMVNTTLTYTDSTPELKVTNPVTPETIGFTITAGTTPKTLTVALDASVSGTNTGDQDLSGLVPYTGATADLEIGAYQISASGAEIGVNGIGILDTTETHVGTLVSPTLTGNRDYTLPDESGIIALTSDITSGLTWSVITGTTQSANVNNGYITVNSSLTTIYSPGSPSMGDIVRIVGNGTGGWTFSLEPGVTAYFGNTNTSAGGSLSSTNTGDCIEVICISSTVWRVMSSVGNITVA